MSRDQLAIAIDFGTTYSGVAYIPILAGHTGPAMNIVQLGSWPGQPLPANSHKVPTTVAYPVDGGTPLWGFEAEKHSDSSYHRVKHFKPYLEPETTREFESPPAKTLHDVVRDFLDGVYAHLVYTLGIEGYSPHDVDYRVLFTVPAPFSNAAVECFRRIVMSTGFANHNISVGLTEPEAAALYTLRTQQHNILRTVDLQSQNKQCFVVCDAGGGTVDLSSYSITQLHPTTAVAQTGVVDGDVCGSTFIDTAFKQFLQQFFGFETTRSLNKTEKDTMMDAFVEKKERYTDALHERSFNIPLPREDLMNYPGTRGGFLPISREQMRTFFEGPVSKTCTLLEKHINECSRKGYVVNFIFLVGGFGTSPYLKARIEQLLSRRTGPPIVVIKPPDAQQSVVLGALTTQMQRVRGDEDPVKVRLCRRSYGIVVSHRFDPTLHYEHERYTHTITGEAMAGQGDPISGQTTVQLETPLTRAFKIPIAEAWTETLVCFAGDGPAPFRFTRETTAICKMTSDLRLVQKSEFQAIKVPAKGWCGMAKKTRYVASYSVKMLVGTADVGFEMWFGGRMRNELLRLSWQQLGDIPPG